MIRWIFRRPDYFNGREMVIVYGAIWASGIIPTVIIGLIRCPPTGDSVGEDVWDILTSPKLLGWSAAFLVLIVVNRIAIFARRKMGIAKGRDERQNEPT